MKEQVLLSERYQHIIHRLPLFNGLTDEFKKRVPDLLDYTLTNIEKGETVIRQGSPCNHLHVLLQGNLEVNIIDACGNRIKVEHIIAPRAFATPHLFDGNNIFPATFTAVEEGVLMRATRESIFKLISAEPELLKNFLRLVGNCNACTMSRLQILSYKKIRSRFAYYLLERKKEGEMVVEMDHNQTQLAEYLGVTRPAFANELRKMVEEGLIRIEGKNVTLLMQGALLKYV